MKIISKVSSAIMVACMIIMLLPLSVEAATGRIMFTDPKTEAGAEFDVNLEIVTYDNAIDSVYIELEYDSNVLEFKSEGNAKLSDGKIVIDSKEGELSLKETLKFRALKNDTTTINVASQVVEDANGNVFEIQEGSSKIEIIGGTEVEAQVLVQVLGVNYKINNNIVDSKIPLGYSRGTLDVEGVSSTVVIGDESDVILVYLEEVEAETTDTGGVPGRYFMYNSDTGVFSPYVQIMVSDSTHIAFLSEEYTQELPIRYIPTTMKADGFEFPAWEDSEEEGYYIVYAMSNKGNKTLYRYDVNDQSYQRFTLEKEKVSPNAVENEQLQEVVDFVAENIIVTLVIVALLVLFLLVLVLIFGLKLRNRNKELDDIYLEGGFVSNIDTSDRDNGYKVKQGKKSKKGMNQTAFDELDDYLDGDYEDDDYEDELFEAQSTEGILNGQGLDMYDDGMTQELNLAIEGPLINDGFIDFKEEMTINQPREDIEPVYEEVYEKPVSREKSKPAKKGFFNRKKHKDDSSNDGIEFIDL